MLENRRCLLLTKNHSIMCTNVGPIPFYCLKLAWIFFVLLYPKLVVQCVGRDTQNTFHIYNVIHLGCCQKSDVFWKKIRAYQPIGDWKHNSLHSPIYLLFPIISLKLGSLKVALVHLQLSFTFLKKKFNLRIKCFMFFVVGTWITSFEISSPQIFLFLFFLLDFTKVANCCSKNTFHMIPTKIYLQVFI